jgi:TPR repeat protein
MNKDFAPLAVEGVDPWDGIEIEPAVRRLAEHAAQAAGLSVEEWLERAVRRSCAAILPPNAPIGEDELSSLAERGEAPLAAAPVGRWAMDIDPETESIAAPEPAPQTDRDLPPLPPVLADEAWDPAPVNALPAPSPTPPPAAVEPPKAKPSWTIIERLAQQQTTRRAPMRLVRKDLDAPAEPPVVPASISSALAASPAIPADDPFIPAMPPNAGAKNLSFGDHLAASGPAATETEATPPIMRMPPPPAAAGSSGWRQWLLMGASCLAALIAGMVIAPMIFQGAPDANPPNRVTVDLSPPPAVSTQVPAAEPPSHAAPPSAIPVSPAPSATTAPPAPSPTTAPPAPSPTTAPPAPSPTTAPPAPADTPSSSAPSTSATLPMSTPTVPPPSAVAATPDTPPSASPRPADTASKPATPPPTPTKTAAAPVPPPPTTSPSTVPSSSAPDATGPDAQNASSRKTAMVRPPAEATPHRPEATATKPRAGEPEPVPGDPKKLASWLEDRAKNGDPASQYRLGVLYIQGQGVTQDYQKASGLFRAAAEAGVAEAQYNVAVMYNEGMGMPRDLTQAVFWYQKAASQGNANAAFNLGVAYANGSGVEQNLEEAARWFRRAGSQGVTNAQFNLALLYERGDGVPVSQVEAYAWYAAAAAHGDAGALQRRDKLAGAMSPSELKEAQTRATLLQQSIQDPAKDGGPGKP